VDKSLGGGMAAVSFPFEYLPLPRKGDEVEALNRASEFVCRATITKVANPPKNDHTPVVTIELPLEFADAVRSIKRPGASKVALAPEAAASGQAIPDDIMVCRCEEITVGEIRKAIVEGGADTVTGVKRRVRAGMGLCQGKSCGRIVTRMIAEYAGKKIPELEPSADRPPVRPITFGQLGGDQNA
jgi:bacterioferritin-associated ferredoxin